MTAHVSPALAFADTTFAVGGQMLFTGYRNNANNMLTAAIWASDGSVEGTRIWQDDAVLRDAIDIGGAWILNTSNGVSSNDSRLWRSDGTLTGTVMYTDATTAGTVEQFVRGAPGEAFMLMQYPTRGFEIWRTDGTASGTRLACDVSSPVVYDLAYAGGRVFASMVLPARGNELIACDPSAAGEGRTDELDLVPGAGASLPRSLTAYNGALYFSATGPDGRRTLWHSDGSASGTRLLRADVDLPQNPSHLRVLAGQLFFSASSPAFGRELWRSDGSAHGTMVHQDFAPGPAHSAAAAIAASERYVYATAYTSGAGVELWAAPFGATQPLPPTPVAPATSIPNALRRFLPTVSRGR